MGLFWKSKSSQEEEITCSDCGESYPKSKMKKCNTCGDIICPKCRKNHLCHSKKDDKEIGSDELFNDDKKNYYIDSITQVSDNTIYTKAAEQGEADAQYNLGVCYAEGNGVTKDLRKALYWIKKAVEQGNAEAQYKFGICYENGDGVTKDLRKALYWYTKAAEQGHAEAQYTLGLCYEKGERVTKDLEKAVYWFTKAAEQGYEGSHINIELCKKEINQENTNSKLKQNDFKKSLNVAQNRIGKSYINSKNIKSIINNLEITVSDAEQDEDNLKSLNYLKSLYDRSEYMDEEAYCRLGDYYLSKWDFNSAVSIYFEAVEMRGHYGGEAERKYNLYKKYSTYYRISNFELDEDDDD